MQKWKDENINWRVQGRDFWLPMANATLIEHRKFLKDNNLRFKNWAWCRKCNHPFWNCKCEDTAYKLQAQAIAKLRFAPFREKLAYSRRLIKQALKEQKGKKMILAYSGGFDSECVLQLLKKPIMKGLIQVAYGNTGCDYPDTYVRLSQCAKELGIEIIKSVPEKGTTFETLTVKYGLPTAPRGSGSSARGATEMCCKYLKHKPLQDKTKGCEVLFEGLRLEENNYRKLSILHTGGYKYNKTTKQWRVYPLAFWTTEDSWKFQKLMGFNYNKIYDKTNCGKKGHFTVSDGSDLKIRSGCWKCPQSIPLGSDEWLEQYYPTLFNHIKKDMAQLSAYIDTMRVLRTQKSIQKRKNAILKIIAKKKAILKKKNIKPCGEPL